MEVWGLNQPQQPPTGALVPPAHTSVDAVPQFPRGNCSGTTWYGSYKGYNRGEWFSPRHAVLCKPQSRTGTTIDRGVDEHLGWITLLRGIVLGMALATGTRLVTSLYVIIFRKSPFLCARRIILHTLFNEPMPGLKSRRKNSERKVISFN